MRPIKVIAWTLILYGLAILIADTADAHTPSDLDAWESTWQANLDNAGGLTPDLLADYLEMTTRHPWWRQTAHTSRHTATTAATGLDPGWDQIGPEATRWRPLVAAWFPPAEVDRAICIIWYESRGDPDAVNTESGAAGLFQHLPRYWTQRSTAAGWAGASMLDPEANVAVAAWLQQDGWQHWTPYNRGRCR